MRVLGVDPGLTRCGLAVIESTASRRVSAVAVGVARSSPDLPLAARLVAIDDEIAVWLDRHRPDAVAVEQVFAQHNLLTVTGTAQVAGLALVAAHRRGLATALHTPTQVKAAVTGSGAAPKLQVQTMVARILGLAELPTPADAADALALAICHAWRPGAAGTRAQSAWAVAEHAAGRRAR